MVILKENWTTLTKPSSITLKEGFNNLNKSVIVMEPFARGYGDTLGNAIRRVLLSSLNGFAVTSIKIEGVMHEYDLIEGIKEDVLDIIMNLKGLSISKDNNSSVALRLLSNKEGPVYAGSIDLPPGVEILNKDHLICTLSKGAKIDMIINVEYGRGYSSIGNNNLNNDNLVGTIKMDSVFSPVKKVCYKVENARVGQITDYDRLIFEIDTNGSITPRDALAISAKILQDQFESFINFDISRADIVLEKEALAEPEFNKGLLRTIEELELSVRSYNCLKNENIIYVGDLVTKTEADMLKTANFGRKSLNELKDNLKLMGLSFGMKLMNWPPRNIEELLKIKNKEF